ncbi:hypothetical protein VSAK1_24875 [Vibrio mediterranei AK1]|uniref:hypothetical protein n=1 Tax=Vibrio mediterranei TaxID=689 RepID=UPI000154048A|nr:hypothetical protein [Vibrio mediterranei]EDL54326.1 hypothetical protein VSAK1_24875 [Vibrio mediterranei AK1]
MVAKNLSPIGNAQKLEATDAYHAGVYVLAKLEFRDVESVGLEDTNFLERKIRGLLSTVEVSANAAPGEEGDKYKLQRVTYYDKAKTTLSSLSKSKKKSKSDTPKVKEHKTILQKIKEILKKMCDKIQDILFGPAGDMLLKRFCSWLVEKVAKNLFNLIKKHSSESKIAGVVKGVTKAVTQTADMIYNWRLGCGVTLLKSPAQDICSALTKAQGQRIIEGIGESVGSAAIIGAQITSASVNPAGPKFVGALAGILSKIFGEIIKFFEMRRIKTALTDAKTMWKDIQTRRQHLATQNLSSQEWVKGAQSGEYHIIPVWLRASLLSSPILASILMASGYLSHPYRFVQMISPLDSVMLQSDFNKSRRYIDRLKKDAGLNIRVIKKSRGFVFTSQNPAVSAMLLGALKGSDAHLTTYDKFKNWMFA